MLSQTLSQFAINEHRTYARSDLDPIKNDEQIGKESIQQIHPIGVVQQSHLIGQAGKYGEKMCHRKITVTCTHYLVKTTFTKEQ